MYIEDIGGSVFVDIVVLYLVVLIFDIYWFVSWLCYVYLVVDLVFGQGVCNWDGFVDYLDILGVGIMFDLD